MNHNISKKCEIDRWSEKEIGRKESKGEAVRRKLIEIKKGVKTEAK